MNGLSGNEGLRILNKILERIDNSFPSSKEQTGLTGSPGPQGGGPTGPSGSEAVSDRGEKGYVCNK